MWLLINRVALPVLLLCLHDFGNCWDFYLACPVVFLCFLIKLFLNFLMGQFLDYFIKRLRALNGNLSFLGKIEYCKCSAPEFLVILWVPNRKENGTALKIKASCQKIFQTNCPRSKEKNIYQPQWKFSPWLLIPFYRFICSPPTKYVLKVYMLILKVAFKTYTLVLNKQHFSIKRWTKRASFIMTYSVKILQHELMADEIMLF